RGAASFPDEGPDARGGDGAPHGALRGRGPQRRGGDRLRGRRAGRSARPAPRAADDVRGSGTPRRGRSPRGRGVVGLRRGLAGERGTRGDPSGRLVETARTLRASDRTGRARASGRRGGGGPPAGLPRRHRGLPDDGGSAHDGRPGGADQGGGAVRGPKRAAGSSRASRLRLRSRPQRNPPRDPSVRTTRWQGTKRAAAFSAQAPAAARTAEGRPAAAAYSVYVTGDPAGTSRRASHARMRKSPECWATGIRPGADRSPA